ncbi:MAG: hypothetical protein C5B51_23575, partial [Terriglobia bacterium]
ASLSHTPSLRFSWFVYLALAMLASAIKLRLPGMTGTYSLNFLFLLYGITRFSLPEVLIAGCAAALVQSLCNVKQRPTLLQVLFNAANLILSVTLCFVVAQSLLSAGLAEFRPAVMAALGFIYFVVNTMLVSGVLSLLEGKSFSEVCQGWYVLSFPYYLAGAAGVGLIPVAGSSVSGEAWLLLVPVAYLIHFFVSLLRSRPAAGAVKRDDQMPLAARLYAAGVIASGLLLLALAAFQWQSASVLRFAAYFGLALAASTLKVQLPGMRGTVSPNFVLLLVAIGELSLAEAVIISAAAGIFQSVWKTKRPPTLTRTLFNGACLSLSAAAAYALCRVVLASWLSQSVSGLLVVSTLALYTCNSLMVATVLCLVEKKPLGNIWQTCYFWSWPYYLVGSGVAGLMIATYRAAGWEPSLLVLPMMGLVYVSYRSHIFRRESAVWGS